MTVSTTKPEGHRSLSEVDPEIAGDPRPGDRVDRRDDPVPLRHGQRPARAEVVLDVGDDQAGIHRFVPLG